ncbi:PP2C family protein-serine/threonine phosphatase [Candidatus Enterococcus clewellii]|uniref:PPM-type phosphatase domain-containing protein n=1 Tax=Candidatus Enterococcus clewellii TaxID=1834193 RepID=A0A242KE22_9ENTE|nr:hypothetical protein [Enterococcus sp. 9E7_DIV0242]OTP19038.1 hypothetical protein A5888_000852 [Enterococcus sp. 9E7_DIV0242]
MRKENSNFKTCYLSESGRRLDNKDYFAFVEENDFACWVMASGIDDSESANSAELAVKSVLNSFIINPGMSRKIMMELIKEAHDVLISDSVRDHLQASIMIVVSDYMNVRWASAGNVHLQCVYNGKIRFASKDQSYYQELVDQEVFPLDRSLGFEERNNLTSYLGMARRLKPFISEKRKLHEMDTLVLTTVGMWEYITDIEILDALHEAKSSQEVIDNLEDLLLSKQPDQLSNYSAAIVMINKLFVKNKDGWKKAKKILLIALPIVIVISILLFVAHRNRVKREEQIQKVLSVERKADNFVVEENYKRALESYAAAIKEREKVNNYPLKRLDKKEKMSQFLVDGDASAEKEDIDTAKKRYTSARDYLVDHEKVLSIFSLEYVNTHLDYFKKKVYINDLEKLGDTQLEAEQYEAAIASYQEAKLAAVELGDQNKVKDLNVKLDTARSKQDLANKDATKAEADKAASEAEQAGENGEDKDLADRYDGIADQYDAAGFSDKASQMRAQAEKIRAEQSKAENAKQEDVAISLEAQGDTALGKSEYDLAVEYYRGAQLIFQEANNNTRVLQVERKIETALGLKAAAKTAQEEAEKAAQEAEAAQAAQAQPQQNQNAGAWSN